jgi:hypothetical protein
VSPVWFVAWMVVGAVGVLGTISLPFLFPVVIVLGVALGLWSRSRPHWWGLISGAGVLLLYVAYVQRHGPGEYCQAIPGGTQCDDYLDPRPWLVLGLLLLLGGVVGEIRTTRARDDAMPLG